jgi:hypothetical protein
MSGSCATRIPAADGGSTRCRGNGVTVTALFTLWVLTRGSTAQANELSSIPLQPLKPEFSAPHDRPAVVPTPFALPETYALMGLPEIKTFPADDFRPRGHSIFDETSPVDTDNAPMLRGSSVWQRLRDFRSHGRVRLLTLWETAGSSVSLQAGKKGEPSLQWTSRSLNRGGATRGLFDQLFSVPLASASRHLHFAPRGGGNPELATPAPKLLDGGGKK